MNSKLTLQLVATALVISNFGLVDLSSHAADQQQASNPMSADKNAVMMFKKTAVLGNIHHAHQWEMKVSALGNTNSNSDQVKNMSQHMIVDHQNADTALKTLANKENVQLKNFQPSESEQAVLDSLEKLHGTAFDMAFLDFQRTAHKGLAGELAMYSSEARDPQIKAMIGDITPTVQQHQKMAANLEMQTRSAMAGQASKNQQ